MDKVPPAHVRVGQSQGVGGRTGEPAPATAAQAPRLLGLLNRLRRSGGKPSPTRVHLVDRTSDPLPLGALACLVPATEEGRFHCRVARAPLAAKKSRRTLRTTSAAGTSASKA